MLSIIATEDVGFLFVSAGIRSKTLCETWEIDQEDAQLIASTATEITSLVIASGLLTKNKHQIEELAKG
jgi:hypothetical protein